jgi:hypothetical protein
MTITVLIHVLYRESILNECKWHMKFMKWVTCTRFVISQALARKLFKSGNELLIRMYWCTKYEVHQAKGYQNTMYWAVSIFLCPVWPLTHWLQNFKTYQCIKHQAKGSQDIGWSVFPHVDIWLFDLKINNGHLLFMM